MKMNYVIRRRGGPVYCAHSLATAHSIASDMVAQAREAGVHCFPVEIEIIDRDCEVVRSFPPDREPTPAELARVVEREEEKRNDVERRKSMDKADKEKEHGQSRRVPS